MKKNIVIRIAGDSGDGVQLMGEQLTITAALAGRDVRTLPDFPAEIRAPAGTLGGVSGFQLAMSEKIIFTAGETVDVLVAMNPAALKSAIGYLEEGSLIILNQDQWTPRDVEKAGLSPTWLDEYASHYQIIKVPLITHTIQALASLGLSASQAKKTKNFYALGLILWLFDFETDQALLSIEKKFKAHPDIMLGNQRACLAGYNYAMTLEWSRQHYQLQALERPQGEYRQVTGVDMVALAMATLATRTQCGVLVAGYPITPASGILHACAKLKAYGVQLFQAEDEIAAIGACLGAAYGGMLALTCTSGPGLDLKSETLGLAVATELPLVVIDVQRAGVSTGMPTKTGQSDLYQALYGRHGEAPLPVLAPKSPTDCFEVVLEAFRIAVAAMTPVIILMDAYLSNAAEPWLIPDPASLTMPELQFNRFQAPYTRDAMLSRSWNIPGTPGLMHHLGGLEKQGETGKISYDPENHQHMVATRAKKIEQIALSYPALCLEGDLDADMLWIGWGSTYGALMDALLQAQQKGRRVALLHLRYLNPLPRDLGAWIKRFQRVMVVELNSGQLCAVLRAAYLVDAVPIVQCHGLPMSASFILQAIETEVSDGKINVYA